MDNKKTNLDDYLADLGISEAEEDAPTAPPGLSAPSLARPGGLEPDPAGPESPPAADLTGSPVGTESGTPLSITERFIRGLAARVDPGLGVSAREVEDAIEVEISGEGAGRLAGRDGRVLGAIELLAYTVLAKHSGRADLRVRVDAGGFRRRHADNLGRVAERIAVQVAKSGEPHELQPMPASDRRIIHIALKEHPDVMTESVGEGPGRRLIVRPRHAG